MLRGAVAERFLSGAHAQRSALEIRVAGLAGSAGNASGGLRWCVTASYADAIFKITGSSPGAPQNSMLNGNGCVAFDAVVPVTEV